MYKTSSPGETLLQTEVTLNLKMNLLFRCQLDQRQKLQRMQRYLSMMKEINYDVMISIYDVILNLIANTFQNYFKLKKTE